MIFLKKEKIRMTQAISNLPINSKVKFGTYKVESEAALPLIWTIVDKNHSGYPANSVTLFAERIIDLIGFDAKEPTNADSNRQQYGNNRYSLSNIDQYLSKLGPSWWTATHAADAIPNDAGMSQPTGYADKLGFGSNFTSAEVDAILPTTIRIAKNTVTDGGSYEDIVRGVYLPSTTELNLANENSIAEGVVLSAFSGAVDAPRIAYPTQSLVDNTLSTSKPASIAAPWYYWLRTPRSTSSCVARYVLASGALNYDIASNGDYGLRPLCNLTSSILVSDSVDSDGCYQTIFTTPHLITLDRPIVISANTDIAKMKFEPRINDELMTISSMDSEKIIFTKTGMGVENVELNVVGENAKLDKLAYTVS